MKDKLANNSSHIRAWVNLADMTNLIDFCIRYGYLKEAAVCCQMLEFVHNDPDVEDFYKNGKEVLLELDFDVEKNKLIGSSVAVNPDFISEDD